MRTERRTSQGETVVMAAPLLISKRKVFLLKTKTVVEAILNIFTENLCYRRYCMCYTVLPVYSVLDVTEDVVDPFSQSFSPFLLLERLGDRKPSAESGLE